MVGAKRLVAALAVVCAPAAAEVVDIDWGTGGRFDHALVVPAGKFVEVCGKLAKGVRIRWEYSAARPLDFNIHYHVGKDVEYPVQQTGSARASGELVTPLDQDYCWMWTNKAADPARLTVTLVR